MTMNFLMRRSFAITDRWANLSTMKTPRGTSTKSRRRGYLDGQMLIAMPAMMDERFARSLIYVCAHSSEGAMGIVVNHPAPNINFSDLLVKLNVIPATDIIRLPTRAGGVKVMRGGPVETERGFVLHSADFFIDAADRRWDLPHRDHRHSEGDRARRGAGERHSGARLCRLGARPA
jgi:Uncharacterized ACR, COG1678